MERYALIAGAIGLGLFACGVLGAVVAFPTHVVELIIIAIGCIIGSIGMLISEMNEQKRGQSNDQHQ